MEIFGYFKSTSQSMLQIFFLGAVGFILSRRKIISGEGVTGLTYFLMGVTLPSLIFGEILSKFSFSLYPDWWAFSLASLMITGIGLWVGGLFTLRLKDTQLRREFISLVGFQNSGYLPLTLLGWIVPRGQLSIILIYLFMFLLGFNLIIWSWGVYFLSPHKLKHFSYGSLFSPPVIAILLGFAFVFLKLNRFMPKFILSPLEMLGHCSFPLAMVVVGANLAELYFSKPVNIQLIAKLILAKLILLPLLGLLCMSYFKLPYLMGLLIILELSCPSAISLAVISRQYAQGEEKIISQGIFLTHIVSLITLPIFLALYNLIVFSK